MAEDHGVQTLFRPRAPLNAGLGLGLADRQVREGRRDLACKMGIEQHDRQHDHQPGDDDPKDQAGISKPDGAPHNHGSREQDCAIARDEDIGR
jgi:hypothetical protein